MTAPSASTAKLALHGCIRLYLNQPIRVDETDNLHDGSAGSDGAKELAVDCGDLLPI